jgi:hypothetical protein
VSAQALVHEVDERLERDALGVVVVRVQRREVALDVEDAPEVFEASLGVPERVALEVEEEIAGRRVGKQREPGARLRRQASTPIPGGGGPADARPRPASVVIPAGASFAIWDELRPATRERWSTASQCASQSGLKSQIPQWLTGIGSVCGGSATNAASREQTRR